MYVKHVCKMQDFIWYTRAIIAKDLSCPTYTCDRRNQKPDRSCSKTQCRTV